MKLSNETVKALQGFLCNATTLEDFYGWVIAASDDEDMPDVDRQALDGLHLLLLEYGEGQRPLDDARAEAKALLASAGPVAASS